MPVEGLDVFEGNGSVDWADVAAAGKRFAICKVSEGNLHDPMFTHGRIAEIRRHKLIAGGYAFLRPQPGRTGAQEVREFFWPAATAAGLWQADRQRVLDVRPVLDVERSAFDMGTEAGRQATIAYVRSAVDAIVELTGGRHPIIYAGSFWRERVHPGTTFGCKLWYPEYGVSAPRLIPPPWRAPSIWQFAETGRVAGVHGNADLDRYLGAGIEELRRELCI